MFVKNEADKEMGTYAESLPENISEHSLEVSIIAQLWQS
jgi:5'-deoxynucleotidase YfbR-like HD superfamily hydrolase